MKTKPRKRKRLTPGEHVIRLAMEPAPVAQPLCIESFTLEHGARRSFLIEAETLPVVGAEAAAFRPVVGWHRLSGFGELLMGPEDDTVTLELPKSDAMVVRHFRRKDS